MQYVFSTLTSDVNYTFYHESRNDLSIIKKSILIKGGANVVSSDNRLFTPKGVVTQVSDEDAELLMTHKMFKDHMDNGFIKIEKKTREIDRAVEDMTKKDLSAPLTPQDYFKNNDPNVAKPAGIHRDRR